jgi:hypothetical protein
MVEIPWTSREANVVSPQPDAAAERYVATWLKKRKTYVS